MKHVNMHEAKTHLSRYLKRLKPGEILILCNRNKPVAELRLVPRKPVKRRVIGWAKGEFTVSPSFFEPMPDEFLKHFE